MKTQFVALIFFLSASVPLLAERQLPTGYLAIPVLVSLSDGSTGSGFYVSRSNYLYLATARHVLFDPKTGSLKGTNATFVSHQDNGTNGGRSELRVDIAELLKIKGIRAHAVHDVAVVRFATLENSTNMGFDTRYVQLVTNTGPSVVPVRSENLRRFSEVNVADDVYVFGYPSSIGLQQSPQFDYSKPLLRKGIIAGINDPGQTVVVDSAVYFGNSGGPVAVREQVNVFVTGFHVIGVVSELIPFVDIWENKRFGYTNANVSNSGYAVVEPVDFILELLWE